MLRLQTNSTESQILWSTVICPTCPLTNGAEHFVYPSTLSCPDGLLLVLLNGAACASCPAKCHADEGSNAATCSENFLSVQKNRTKTWNQRGAHARRTAPWGSNSSAGDIFEWGVSVCDWQPSWTPPAALFEFFLDRSHSHRFLRSFSVALLDSAAILAAPTPLYERTLLQNRPWDVCIAFDILDS